MPPVTRATHAIVVQYSERVVSAISDVAKDIVAADAQADGGSGGLDLLVKAVDLTKAAAQAAVEAQAQAEAAAAQAAVEAQAQAQAQAAEEAAVQARAAAQAAVEAQAQAQARVAAAQAAVQAQAAAQAAVRTAVQAQAQADATRQAEAAAAKAEEQSRAYARALTEAAAKAVAGAMAHVQAGVPVAVQSLARATPDAIVNAVIQVAVKEAEKGRALAAAQEAAQEQDRDRCHIKSEARKFAAALRQKLQDQQGDVAEELLVWLGGKHQVLRPEGGLVEPLDSKVYSASLHATIVKQSNQENGVYWVCKELLTGAEEHKHFLSREQIHSLAGKLVQCFRAVTLDGDDSAAQTPVVHADGGGHAAQPPLRRRANVVVIDD